MKLLVILILGLFGFQQLGYTYGAHVTVAAKNPAPRPALPASRQVTANWGVNTYRHGGQMFAIEHINYRHAFNSGFKNVSRFAEGTSVRNIQGNIEEVAQSVIKDAATNTATKTVVVDTTGLTANQIKTLKEAISKGTSDTAKKIIYIEKK